ncbi:MAG: PAS domain S-box protein, partial [Chloroflexota bacterium]
MNSLQYWINPPVFPGDIDKTRRARLLNSSLLLGMLYLLVVIGVQLVTRTEPDRLLIAESAVLVLFGVFHYLLRRGSVDLIGGGLVMLSILWFTMLSANRGAADNPATAAYLIAIVLAGLLFEWRGLLAATAASSLAVAGLLTAQNNNLLPPPDQQGTFIEWFSYSFLFGLIGVLSLYTTRMARQSLQRAELEMAERERSARLQETVYRIAEAAQAAASLDELYPLIHQHIAAVMEAHNFYIALFDAERDTKQFVYSVDEFDQRDPAPQPVGLGLTAYILRTGKPLLFHRDAPEVEIELPGGGTRCKIWLGVPLIDHERTIGVMTVQHYTDPNAYGETEQRMLEYVSTQVASAIARKQTQQAMRLVEKRNQALIENAPDGIALLDATGFILFGSPSAYRMFGYSPAEILGRPSLEHVHPQDARDLHHKFLRLVNGPTHAGFSAECRYLHKDGQYRWVEASFHNLLDEAGVNAVVTNFRDITQRVETDRELQRIRDGLELAQSIAHLGSWEYGIDQQSERHWSKEMYHLFRWDPSRPLPEIETFIGSLRRDDQPGFFAAWQRVQAGSGPVSVEFSIDYPDHDRRYYAVTMQLSIGEQGRRSITGTTFDITEIKNIQIELQSLNRDLERRVEQRSAEVRKSRDELFAANIALEKANKLKDEFLASMSHELRTPLTGVLGLAEALQYQTYGELNEKQLKAIHNIELSGRHLLELINDILDLSKIGADKMDLRLAPCSV